MAQSLPRPALCHLVEGPLEGPRYRQGKSKENQIFCRRRVSSSVPMLRFKEGAERKHKANERDRGGVPRRSSRIGRPVLFEMNQNLKLTRAKMKTLRKIAHDFRSA